MISLEDETLNGEGVLEKLMQALAAREEMIDPTSGEALRLFNGFYEGYPNLVVDLYGQTLVLFDYHDTPQQSAEVLTKVQVYLLERFNWLDCVVQKVRSEKDHRLRRGTISYGSDPAQSINEYGIYYAVDLTLNQDASFYLDTRALRRWLLDNSSGWRLLNTFAYTGSLGIAALAGGAAHVVQLDRSRKFLELARRSGMLNRLDIGKMKLRAVDFFSEVAALKSRQMLFDCVIVDPPFFSTSKKGTIDLERESQRVINKVRPLVTDGGRLVAINNALFLSGGDYMRLLESLCRDGYLSIEEIIPVPPDMTGFPQTLRTAPPRPTAPFNHPTKIVVLRVKRAG